MKPIPYTPSGSPTTSDPAIRRIPRVCHPSSPPHHPHSLPVRSAASFSSSRLLVLSAIPPNPPHRSPPCYHLHPLPAIVPSTFSPGSAACLPSHSTASSSSSHLPILSPVPPNPPCQLPPCYRLHPLSATAPSAALPASTAHPLHLATCPLLFRRIHIHRLPVPLLLFLYLSPSFKASEDSGLLHLTTSADSLYLAQRAHACTFPIGLHCHPILSSALISAYSHHGFPSPSRHRT